MAERSISVRLSARVDSYVAAMARAKAATTGFSKDSQRNMAQVGASMQTAGRRMTMGLTLPLLGIGGAAVKMSTGFDRSMSLITGLVGVSREEVDKMRDSVMELSGETARSPQELAEALYFVTSSGFAGSEALDVLEASAKAAAAGLGDTSTIADLVTSAVNAYGSDVLSAAEATDILTTAVKLGKGEPDELASSMGRVLPVASEMGVEFDEVAAAMASMSLTGLDANESATALRGIFTALLSPTAEAKDALSSVGLSVEEIHDSLANDGLLATLHLLQESFGGNAKATDIVFGNVRALTGVLSMLGDNGEQTAAIFDDMTDSTGATDEAFQAMTETSGFELQQAWVKVQTALIALGDVLVPVVASVAGGLASLAEWFANLSGPIQAIVAAFGGLVAAAGPLIFIAGTLIRNFVAIRAGLALIGPAAATATKALGAIGLAITGAVLIYQWLSTTNQDAENRIDAGAAALDTQTRAAYDNATAAAEAGMEVNALALANEALSLAIANSGNDELTDAMVRLNIGGSELLETLVGLKAGTIDTADILVKGFGASDEAAQALVETLHGATADEADQAWRDFGATLNWSDDQIAEVRGSLFDLSRFAIENSDEINAMALEWLNARVQASDLETSMVGMAEEIAGSRFEAGNAVPVFQALMGLLLEADPAAAAAALGIDGVGASATAATPAVDAANAALADLGIEGTAAAGVLDHLNFVMESGTGRDAQLFWAALAETLGFTAEEAEMVALAVRHVQEFGAPDAQGWENWAAAVGLAPDELESTVMQLIAVQDAAEGAGIEELPPKFEMASGGAKEMARQFTIAAEEAEELAEVSSEMSRALDDASEAANRLRESIDAVIGPGDDLRETARAVWAEFDNLNAALEENGISFEVNTEEGRANQEQLEETRDAILAHGVAMVRNGASAEEAAADIAFNTASLVENLRAANVSEDAIEALLIQYGLTPESVETILRLEGEAFANQVIARYKRQLDRIPERERTLIEADIAEGDFARADARLDYFENRTWTAWIRVYADTWAASQAIAALARAARGYSYGGFGGGWRSAHGRFVPGGSNMVTSVGEDSGRSGDEVILPLGKPGDMQRLLAMDGVGNRIAAAMSGTMTPATHYGLGTGSAVGASSTGPTVAIGELHVGDRNDLAAARAEVETLAWKVTK